MINLTNYIKLPREERRSHLQLNEPCIERGGCSTQHKGVLAQYLNSEIPSGNKIILCHACNNGKCSNPHHIYWGTAYDNNIVDQKLFGNYKNIWERSVEKYGLEEAKIMNGKGNKSAGGKANKGKVLSSEHKQKISNSLKSN
jgi:hypothetical protein